METAYGEIPDRLVRSMSLADLHDYLQRPSRRSFLKGALAVGGAAAAGPTFWAKPARAATPPAGVHLSYGKLPTTSMSVVWSTPGNVAHPRLQYGIGGDLTTVPASSRTVGGLKSVSTVYHQVRLTDLEPGTAYDFRVLHDGSSLDGLSFRTAATDGPFTFTAFGDQGLGTGAAQIGQQVAAINPAFNLVAGDLCYADDLGFGLPTDIIAFDPAVWDSWFQQNNASMRAVPWMPAVGNHDIEPGQGDHGYAGHEVRLALPGEWNDVVYSFRYGNVAVVALDANDISEEIPSIAGYSNGSQTEWLDGKLAQWRADDTIDFIVVYFHHCAYCTISSHGSDGGVRAKWVPLFDKHRVDLVINGHNHGYERTTRIRDNRVVTDGPGTTYITAGGGGRSPDEFAEHAFISHGPAAHELGVTGEPEESPWSNVRKTGHSFLRVDVEPATAAAPATMTVIAMNQKGVEFDRVVLTPQPAAAPEQPQQPSAGGTAGKPAGGTGTAPTGGESYLVPAALAAGAGLALARASRA